MPMIIRVCLLWAVVAACAAPCAAQDAKASPSATPAAKRIAIMIGERPQVTSDSNKPEWLDIAPLAAGLLGSEISDQTTKSGQLATATLEYAKAMAPWKPKTVVVFTGSADQKAATPEEQHTATLQSIVKVLSDAGAAVYIVPSTPSLRAGVSFNLRKAANESGATYIETGTEIMGKPFDEVFTEVHKAEDARLHENTMPAAFQPAQPIVAQQADSSGTVVQAGPAATPALIYMRPAPALKAIDPIEQRRASKAAAQTEKNRKKPALER